MWHVGIDLHRLTVVIAAVNDEGNSSEVRRISCQDRQVILETMSCSRAVCAVIEATGTYRWLALDPLAPLGTVLLVHPLPVAGAMVTAAQQDRQTGQPVAG